MTTPTCTCGSTDVCLMQDYGNNNGRWECGTCHVTIYQMDDKEFIIVKANTMRAAQEAFADADRSIFDDDD